MEVTQGRIRQSVVSWCFEPMPLETLARSGQLMAYEHPGYWQCMDTIRDRDALQVAWESGRAPWLGK